MCRDCGCEEVAHSNFAGHHHHHDHSEHPHSHDGVDFHEHTIDGKIVRHSHAHPNETEASRKIRLEVSILEKNDRIAQENRSWFEAHQIRAINIISSPGSGKTFLLEKTIGHFKKDNPDFSIAIITGDQEQDYDAQRLKASGANVLQLNTLNSCHLDASMIQKTLGTFVRPKPQLLIIENVGNLVCPAAFDLGEKMKVALLSTPEGEDKPTKYPRLFQDAGMIIITKTDLIPHLDWKLQVCETHLRRVNPTAPILKLSAKTGEGLEAWFEFLR